MMSSTANSYGGAFSIIVGPFAAYAVWPNDIACAAATKDNSR